MLPRAYNADDAKIYIELNLGLSNDLCTACDRIAYVF